MPPKQHVLTSDEQKRLMQAIAAVLDEAPFFRPTLPRWGTPFSVRMSNCGSLGWLSDKSGGYRYEPLHPDTGRPWPPIPKMLLELWDAQTGGAPRPEACLINHYGPTAKMGLHQDKDEADFSVPVLSVSLGDTARFRLGGQKRDDPKTSFDLVSGDVMSLSGAQRLAFHGIDRIYAGTSDLLGAYPDLFPEGGRINLTLRRVAPAG